MKPEPQNKAEMPVKMVEGIHFYIESGMYVFTEKYLRERGFCCENGCRHCPYSFEKKP